jgi:L-arabinokinase
VRTSAPRWLFDRTADAPIEFDADACDTGVVQIDSLRLDEGETIRRADAFHRELEARAAGEARRLPLAIAAAAAAGVPSVAIGNFTWDWIYEGYPEALADAPGLLLTIRQAHARAAVAWRLPMWGGFEGFPHVVDVPFVARHSSRDPSDVRRALRLPPDRRLALMSFGGYGVEGVRLEDLDCRAEWSVVVTDAPGHEVPAGVVAVREADLYGQGLRYQDLVRAVDVVVTKPGYGIIAECIANGAALLYTSRGRFREYDVLVREMPRYLRCEFLDQESLLAGRWRAALDRLVAQPAPPEHPRTDGAEVVAGMILDIIHDQERGTRNEE